MKSDFQFFLLGPHLVLSNLIDSDLGGFIDIYGQLIYFKTRKSKFSKCIVNKENKDILSYLIVRNIFIHVSYFYPGSCLLDI